MTWWEVEEVVDYVSDLESRLDEWSMSNPQMRIEQQTVDRFTKKLNKILSESETSDKKVFLTNLAGRVEELRQHLIERLKRDIPS